MTSWSQGNNFTTMPGLSFNETKQLFDSNGISQNWIILADCTIAFSASQNRHFYDRKKGTFLC
jgi:uncharacterized membrane protein